MLFVSDAEKLVHDFNCLIYTLSTYQKEVIFLSLIWSISVKLLWNNMYCDKVYKLHLKVHFEWTSSLKLKCIISAPLVSLKLTAIMTVSKSFPKDSYYWLKNKKPRPKLTPLATLLLLCHTDMIFCFETTTEPQCCHLQLSMSINLSI